MVSRMALPSLIVLIVGFAGCYAMRDMWIGFVLSHVGDLGSVSETISYRVVPFSYTVQLGPGDFQIASWVQRCTGIAWLPRHGAPSWHSV
jgi:hypothetical protein